MQVASGLAKQLKTYYLTKFRKVANFSGDLA